MDHHWRAPLKNTKTGKTHRPPRAGRRDVTTPSGRHPNGAASHSRMRILFRRRFTRSTLTCDAEVTRWLWVYGAVFLSWFPCESGSVVRRSTANGFADARRTAGRPWSSCRCPSNTQTLGLPRTRKTKCQDGACPLRFAPLTLRMAPSWLRCSWQPPSGDRKALRARSVT